MNKDQPVEKRKPFTLYGLSIRQRLPLLICVLLLCIIISFSFTSYYSVRKASMEMGRERLRSVTNELGAILSQSTSSLVSLTKKTADNDTIRRYLGSGGKELREEALDILKKTRTDSTAILAELLDSNSLTVLSYNQGNDDIVKKLGRAWKPAFSPGNPNTNIVGKMFAIDSSVFFPITATITFNKIPVGYLLSWRRLITTPQAVEQISKLIGKDAVLYIGNNDGSLWTDMLKTVASPPVNLQDPGKYFEYTDKSGTNIIAAAQPITNSNWIVLIEFSRETVLEGASRFLKWTIIIGALLIFAGIFIASAMSRNITRPLNQLTSAATAVSKGDYSIPVNVDRHDELGELASAFNIMTEQVHANQVDLEQKVLERTSQLESANRELEAFSYSVSHDLRAPLRGIMGFTNILEEEYAGKLDDEARRITSVIKSNALKMGNLIDGLLSFSKMSRHDILKSNIRTEELVKDVISSSDTKNKDRIKWVIGALPDVSGDINTIRQVWINLISNAIKYSERRDQPVIEVGSFPHEGQIAFFVKDNGVGFDNRYKDKLFKVFQRLHNAEEFEGTGIGLATVEKIISKHGGTVWAEATAGQGATFYFSLPPVE